MVFPIAGGNESKGYDVENSLRFNDGDSAYLSRSTGTASSEKKFTFSTWVKLGASVSSSSNFALYTSGTLTSSTDCFRINFASHALQFVTTGATDSNIITNRVFRDPNAWYHILISADTTQGTASNRIKIYINGVLETSFGTSSYPSQDYTFDVSSQTAIVGANNNPNAGGLGGYYDGYMTETHYIDGTAKAQTDFGEFDDNGVWIPKKYTGSYGTNGFYLEFQQTGTSQNSSGIGADTSGNDNHFAVTNLAALDVTEDTCTNNFATLNALNFQTSSALSEGNTKIVGVNADQFLSSSSIGVDEGKWYVEAKLIALSGGQAQFGITSDASEQNRNNRWVGQDSYSYGLASNDGLYNNASTVTYSNATYTTNDIISIALDLDNNLIYFYKNGTVMNSGTGYSITDPASTTNGFYFFAVSDGNSDYNATWEMNFGNPPFSISSGNNDGKYGDFEYAPPSGYYALCTKRLAEFG